MAWSYLKYCVISNLCAFFCKGELFPAGIQLISYIIFLKHLVKNIYSALALIITLDQDISAKDVL